MTDGRTFHFTTDIGINVRQMDKLRFITPSTSDYVLFHSHVVVLDRQTDKLRFISLILSSKKDKVTFHPSYWNPRKTDGQTTLHPSYKNPSMTDGLGFMLPLIVLASMQDKQTVSFHPHWNPSKTDGQTLFIHHTRARTRQTDKLIFISPLMFAFQTNVIFHSIYWHPSTTVRLTRFHLYPHIGIQVRQTDKLCSYIIQEPAHDRRTN